MKGTDQVLAQRVIDADLAPNCTVDLREKRRGHLNDGDSSEICGGGKAGDITGDPPAYGDDGAGAVRVRAYERVVDAADCREMFVTLTVGNQDRLFGRGTLQRTGVKAPDRRARH